MNVEVEIVFFSCVLVSYLCVPVLGRGLGRLVLGIYLVHITQIGSHMVLFLCVFLHLGRFLCLLI